MTDHYFSPSPSSHNNLSTFDVALRGKQVTVSTSSGVFSPGGLDKGTAVFLDKVSATDLTPGSLAVDLGCGWGPITLALAEHYADCDVVGVDVNERSVALTNANVTANGYSNASAMQADVFLDELVRTGRKIDLIWSNPPIRIGKSELHKLLTNWLTLLSDDGIAFMVVQKNLGADSLSAWLTDQGFPTTKLGSSKGFRILQTRRS